MEGLDPHVNEFLTQFIQKQEYDRLIGQGCFFFRRSPTRRSYSMTVPLTSFYQNRFEASHHWQLFSDEFRGLVLASLAVRRSLTHHEVTNPLGERRLFGVIAAFAALSSQDVGRYYQRYLKKPR